MCKALEDLRLEGIEEGISKGTIATLSSLVKDGLIQISDAAKQMNISETDFCQKMKEAGF